MADKIKPSDAKASDLHYVTIKDFRPGIYSNVRTNAVGGIVDAEIPGMAREGTIGCIANTTGQLVPLPQGFPNTFTFPIDGTAHPFQPGGAGVSVGIATVGPIVTAGATRADDIWVFANYCAHISPSFFDIYRAVVIKGGTTPVTPRDAMQGQQILNMNAISKRGVTTAFTRGRRSSFNSPGFPIFCWEYTSGEPYQDGAIAHYDVYPDPNALNSDNYYQETYTVNNANSVYGGQILAHTGRILRLCENKTDHGLNVDFETNELVRYTDPPGNVILSNNFTDSVLDPQIPGGYGSWGSLSYGELLLIKRVGGAILVEGDVYAPQITRLPGVADVGNLTNVACATPAGLIYCCQDDGAYIWTGGSTSQKISTISDRFAIPPVLMANGVKTNLTLWNNWVIFSNGWMFDTVMNGWWQLDVSQALPEQDGLQWAAAGKGSPRYLYVVPGDLTNFGDNKTVTVGTYDLETPSNEYTWKSQPMAVSYGHSIDIREICLTVSNISNDTTVEVTFQTINGDDTGTFPGPERFQITTGGANVPGPIRLRKPIGVIGDSVMLTIHAITISPSPAPTLNCIEIGYLPATPFGQFYA